MIPSGTVARFLPLKRLKTRIVWVAARRTPEDTKARLHAQPACCHGNIIAHHHGLFSLRFVRSVKLIDFGNLLDHESPLLSNPLRASLLEQRLACMSPRLLLKGAQAFTVYFLSWPTRGESFRGSAAGSEVAEGRKKILGSNCKWTGKRYWHVNRGRLYGREERSGQMARQVWAVTARCWVTL